MRFTETKVWRLQIARVKIQVAKMDDMSLYLNNITRTVFLLFPTQPKPNLNTTVYLMLQFTETKDWNLQTVRIKIKVIHQYSCFSSITSSKETDLKSILSQ